MNTLAKTMEQVFATEVWFAAEKLFVRLADGREIGVPLHFFPRLQNATAKQRAHFRLIGRGSGIHWEDLDEDTDGHWCAQIDFVPNEEFDLLIEAGSLDFMAVRNTHSIVKKLIADIPSIRQQMIQNITENLQDWADNRTDRKEILERLKKNLKVFSIKIYYDLSSEIEFSEEGFLDRPIDEWGDNFYVVLDTKGEFLEAGIED